MQRTLLSLRMCISISTFCHVVDEINIRVFEPGSNKIYKLAWAPIGHSDQTAHVRSLIKVFGGRSMGSQRSNVSSGGSVRLIRLYGCAD